jgi:hypothetical protein
MASSIREALEGAMAEGKTDEPTEQPTESVATEPETPQVDDVVDSKEQPEEKATLRQDEESSEVPVVAEKKEEPVVKDKPPASWKAGAKERWSSLPPEARAEINRREREINIGLQQAAEKSRFADTFARTIEPYRASMAAEGVTDPMVAVSNLLQTANTLRMGTTVQRATTIAKLIEYYGVDLPTLDGILAGNAQTAVNPTSQFEELLNQKLAPLQQMLQYQQQQEQFSQQQLYQEANETIEQFIESGKAEYFEEVREDMADLLDMAAKRGRQMSIQEAYDRACLAHPEISKIVQRQKFAPAVDINRARAASSSISGSPAPKSAGDGGGDIRSALLAAMAKNTR